MVDHLDLMAIFFQVTQVFETFLFENSTTFIDTQFYGNTDVSMSTFNNHINFSGASFYAIASFEMCQFKSVVRFRETKFLAFVSFSGCSILDLMLPLKKLTFTAMHTFMVCGQNTLSIYMAHFLPLCPTLSKLTLKKLLVSTALLSVNVRPRLRKVLTIMHGHFGRLESFNVSLSPRYRALQRSHSWA